MSCGAIALAQDCASMTTLAEVQATLPGWGLHDARLERAEIDWLARRAVLELRLMMSESQDMDQRGRLILDGLVYCSIDPPEIDPAQHCEPTPPGGARLDSGPGVAPTTDIKHPSIPPGTFVQWFFVSDWNAFIHVAAEAARFEWIETEPGHARSDSRALFPGDEIDLGDSDAAAPPATDAERGI
jgi:hypothetical protein